MLAQRYFRVTMSSRDLDQGFDRERILEWLQSVDLHQPTSEPDEGSPSDPDQSTPGPQHAPTQRTPLRLSPLLQGQRRAPALAPTMASHSHQQQLQQRPTTVQHGSSVGGLVPPVTERVGTSSNLTFGQSPTHLLSLHSRQESESPLPEVPSCPELPIFNPQAPTAPGSRTPKLSLRSDSLRHLLIPHGPNLGTAAAASSQDLPLSETDTSTSQQEREVRGSSTTRTGALETGSEGQVQECPGLGVEEEEMRTNPEHSPTPPTQQAPVTTSPHHGDDDKRSNLAPASLGNDEPVQKGPPTEDTLSQGGKCSEREGEREFEREREEEGESEREREGEQCAPLTPLELATLSLQVGDILPQLAVYLGVDYEEYEQITSTEPSLQRQSMAVLMKWFRSCSTDSRQELAHTLHIFGGEYNQLAQMLLKCELAESRHPHKPAASPSPAPLSRSSQSHPPQAHPAWPRPLISSTSSFTPPLADHSRKLKQGFTFDEDKHSSDVLPKFLSTRSLQASSSPEFRLPPSSRKVLSSQRHLSLSEGSSHSASSSPVAPGFASSLHLGRRKTSLQLDEVVQTTKAGSSSERVGEHALGSRRKSGFGSGEISRVLLGGDRDELSVPYSRSDLHRGSLRSTLAPLGARDDGREEREITAGGGSSFAERGTKPRVASHRYGGAGGQRKMKRQDSGIETLASNLSGIQ